MEKEEKMSCTCSGIQESSNFISEKKGDVETNESERKTIGTACVCGEKKFSEISLNFNGPSIGKDIEIPQFFERSPFFKSRVSSMRKNVDKMFNKMDFLFE